MKSFYALLIVLPLIAVLGGCLTKVDPDASRAADLKDTKSSASLTIVENDLDLGDIINTNGTVDAEFTFRNDGDEPVLITGGGTSCMCTEAVMKFADGDISPRMKMPGHGPAPIIEEIIDPGEEAQLIATFDPMAHGPDSIGPITRDVVIETNSSETPKLEFSFIGNVVRE